MIWLEYFKDRPAVCIQNSQVKATFLPLDGAKMVSLVRLKDGKELLAVKPNKNYKVLTFDGDYVSSECSGFDDMFPTVDPYTPTVGAFKGITYPDHGETSRIPYDLNTTGGEIILFANSKLSIVVPFAPTTGIPAVFTSPLWLSFVLAAGFTAVQNGLTK